MERHHAVAALAARNANVTDDAANSSTGSQHSCTLAPDFIELVEESVVILDLAELKLSELSRLLARGRRQLQAWLDAKFPQPGHV